MLLCVGKIWAFLSVELGWNLSKIELNDKPVNYDENMEECCFDHFIQNAHPPFEHTSKVVLDIGVDLLASVDIYLLSVLLDENA